MDGIVVLPAPVPALVIEASPTRAFVIVAGAQGVAGPAGPSGEAVSTIALTASATISGYTAVALAGGSAVPASSANSSQQGNVVGIAANGANAGETVNVQYGGPLTYNGWDWTPGLPVFLGANGALTQTVPTSGFLQAIGIPLNSTTLLVQMQPAITIQ